MRVQFKISMDIQAYERLKILAAQEHAAPATLATRLILTAMEREFAVAVPESPTLALTAWLAPHIDLVREAGGWSESVTIDFFELIEREHGDLYAAAAAERGQPSLNMHLGRFIRTRLGAEVVRRNDKPYVARVPAHRTTLIKNFTYLKS